MESANTYEEMIIESFRNGAEVLEVDLGTNKKCGYCYGNLIIINKSVTEREKRCILVEELGHLHTTVGDITDLTNINSVKQEEIARRWGYRLLIPLEKLIALSKTNLKYDYEVAEELDVTIPFLNACVEYYKCIYREKFIKEE